MDLRGTFGWVTEVYGGANPWKILNDSGIAHQCLILSWANPTIVLSVWGYPAVLIYYTGTAQVSKKYGGANPWNKLSDSGIAHQHLILLWDDPTIVLSVWGYPTVLSNYTGTAQVSRKYGGANPWRILSDSGIAHK
jgi:hypothetical protein